jgi:aspartate carbamoyltransferase catalytic subunit
MQPPIDHRPGAQIQGRAVFPHASPDRHRRAPAAGKSLFLLDEAEQWIER